MSKIKLAGKSISEILKRIKRAKRNKKATQNQEKAGLSTKSIKPFNYRASARNEQIVPVKKQSQTGSSFQPHRVRGKQGEASIKGTSEGSAASWRDEMDKYFGDLRPSKFFKKASGGDINTGMKKLSPKQKAIAAKAPPPDKIDAKDFAVLKAEKAKGRGMGLQDEKIKPGKVMTAREGKMFKGYSKVFETGAEHGAKGKQPSTIVGVKPNVGKKVASKIPGRIGKTLGVVSMLVPAAYAAAKQYKDYKSAKNRDKAKVKKYSKGMSKEDITREGKRGIAAGKALGESLRDKNAPMKRQRLADRQPVKKKNILDKFTDKLNKAGEAYKKLGGAGLNVLRGNTKGQPFPAKKMGGGMMRRYSKGGGADTGTAGEVKSKFAVALDRVRRRARKSQERTPGPRGSIPERLSRQDIVFTTDKSFLKDMKPPSGAAPGKFKSGTMVKARGCKLGRSKPTKMY